MTLFIRHNSGEHKGIVGHRCSSQSSSGIKESKDKWDIRRLWLGHNG